MFFNSNIFWFLMGIVFILVAAGFRASIRDRGYKIGWWKAILAFFAYAIFMASFYAWGTLMGENELSAGLKFLGFGLLISVVLAAITWRLVSNSAKSSVREN